MTEQSPPIKPPPGFRVLLEGPAGTGKTTACRTLVAAGLTPFFVFTEPSMNMVGDIPCPKLHYTYSGQESIGWGAMIKNAKNIAFIQNEDLQKAGRTGVGLNTWVSFLEHFNNYICDRCGESFGDVEKWGTDRVLIVDGLTGLSKAARLLAVGFKSILSQPDWGVAMTQIDQMIFKLKSDLQCHLVMIAHIEPEKNEVTGGVKNYPSTLGRKLGPIIPTYFQDVILASVSHGDFYWTTVSGDTDTVGRNLPLKDKMSPDFAPLLAGWKAKSGMK